MIENRNTILAVILSGLVLLGWQYFFNLPQLEKQRAAKQAQREMMKPAPQADSANTPAAGAAPAPPRRQGCSRYRPGARASSFRVGLASRRAAFPVAAG